MVIPDGVLETVITIMAGAVGWSIRTTNRNEAETKSLSKEARDASRRIEKLENALGDVSKMNAKVCSFEKEIGKIDKLEENFARMDERLNTTNSNVAEIKAEIKDIHDEIKRANKESSNIQIEILNTLSAINQKFVTLNATVESNKASVSNLSQRLDFHIEGAKNGNI